MQLSLDHLTIFDVQPAELVRIAAELSIPYVSLWTQLPLKAELPLVTQANRAETLRAMRETGVRLGNMECFNLTAEAVVEDFRPAVALGAELGATSLVAINAWDPEPARTLDKFSNLCRTGAEYGLKVNVEFISMGKVRTLADAVQLVTDSGQRNAGITIDILHLTRTGSTPADISAIDPKLIGYAQICDGPAGLAREEWNDEGFEQRQIPGEGEFPLVDFIAALPDDIILGVEVPLKSLREAGVGAAERARRAVAGTRAIVG
ncbi:MAG: sugar phosphate isomerase/epimerase [Rhodospirillales bacterium]|nr:sugar phosphate isomerase/epimerase [Rhodospirillales bacterium]